jgi:hypothetical protein
VAGNREIVDRVRDIGTGGSSSRLKAKGVTYNESLGRMVGVVGAVRLYQCRRQRQHSNRYDLTRTLRRLKDVGWEIERVVFEEGVNVGWKRGRDMSFDWGAISAYGERSWGLILKRS